MPAWRPAIESVGLKANPFCSHETQAVKSMTNAGAATDTGLVPGAWPVSQVLQTP